MGLAGHRHRVRSQDAARRRFASSRAMPASATRAPGAVLRRRGARGRAAGGRRGARSMPPDSGRASTPTGRPRLRADALVGQALELVPPAYASSRRARIRSRRDGARPRGRIGPRRRLGSLLVGTGPAGLAERFARAYRHYCWPVESLRDIRLAPLHVMAPRARFTRTRLTVAHGDGRRLCRRARSSLVRRCSGWSISATQRARRGQAGGRS